MSVHRQDADVTTAGKCALQKRLPRLFYDCDTVATALCLPAVAGRRACSEHTPRPAFGRRGDLRRGKQSGAATS